MKKIIMLLATVAFFAACSDDDERIEVKDYGMKTFSADLKHKKADGMAKDFTCKQQIYFSLGKGKAVATGEYGKESWTTFNVLPKVPKSRKDKTLIKNPKYNVSTKVKGWDLLFTQYVGDAMPGKDIYPYFLAGVLINTDNVEVGLLKYKKSKKKADIAKAFAELKKEDISKVTYSKEIDVIGTSWRSMRGMRPVIFGIYDNHFYILKTKSGDYYKVHFLAYHGNTKDSKVFKFEYALMK